MSIEVVSIKGILLKKTFLVNDDAFLEFFTDTYGKVQVSVKKLARSKKKNAEIDFFRILDLKIQKGRTGNYALKEVRAIRICSELLKTHAHMLWGFRWLERVKQITSEHQPDPHLFHVFEYIMTHVDGDFIELFDVYFRIYMLQSSGVFVRFDTMRGDVYFNPIFCTFSKEKKSGSLLISNRIRQIIEFLRRSDIEELEEKKTQFSNEECASIRAILEIMEKNHFNE